MIGPLRALPYREFSVAATFSPIRADVVERVPDALLEVLRHPSAIGPRSLMGTVPPESFAADAVETTMEHLVAAGAIDRVRNATTPQHPLRVLVSHERVTFAISHAYADGIGIAELIGAVMSIAAGETPRFDTRPPVRYPLLVGMRSVGLAGIRDFLHARRTATIIGPDAAEGAAPGRSTAVEVPIEPKLLERIDRLGAGGRSTPGARLASVSVGALARVHRRDVDVPVSVPVSLKRHVGGGRVLGNFIGIEPLGTLHASDWSAEAITARLVDATRSGRAMVGLAYAVLRAARYAVVPGPATRRHARVAVSMQILALPDVLPVSAWATSDWRSCAATIGPWPSSTALAPFRMGTLWGVSAWDESGDFDLAAFPAALLAEVAAREAASTETRS